jgi:predicted transcriptional regulator
MEKKRRRGGWPARTPEPGERVAMSFRVTPEVKAKIDEAARTSGRSLMQEVENRLEQTLNEERHVIDALELGFGRQVAGLMLAIGCVMKNLDEVRPTRKYADWLSNPKVFRVVAESISLWLETIAPDPRPTTGERLRKALHEAIEPDSPGQGVAIVAAGLTEDEEWMGWIDLGPLAPIIRGWLGAAAIERLKDILALPTSPSK